MSYSQERLESQQLFDYSKLGQKIALNIAKDFADSRHQFSIDSDWTQISQRLTQEMTGLVDLEKRLNDSIEASVRTEHKIRQLISDSENADNSSLMAVDISQTFEEYLQQINGQNNTRVEDNPNYKELMEVLQEFGEHNVSPNADNEANDDELMALETETNVIPIDPFSKTPIEIPVKNTKCGHLYDREQLRRILEAKGPNGHQRCPAIGCNNRKVTLNDVKDDRKTKALIDNLKRNQN